jgi:WD40 repeat protein
LEVLQEAGVKSSNLRKTSEQVYQQRTGEMWEELFNTLTSFNFLDARCRAASVYDIESDFRLALSGWQGDSAHKKSLDAFEERLRLESHHLGRYPEILFPQLYNYLTWVDKEENGPIHGLCEKVRPSYHNWLRTIQDPRPVPSLWMVAFEGHTHIVSSVVITPDSQLVISGSYDKSIKIWELETGRLLRSLLGHEGRVVFLAVSPDGKTIVSRALDDTLRIWDLESGRLLRTIARKLDLREETMITLHGSLNGLVLMITPDGSRIYFAPGLSLQVIDLNSGRLLGSRDGYHVWGLTPDGQQAIIMPRDLTFEVWDVETWKPVSVLEGEAHIFYMAFTAPDGKRLGIGSNRMKEILMVWDLETGRLLRSVIKPKEIHLLENTKLATPDGQKIIVAKGWHMNVWDLENGQVEDFHGYHDGDIYNIALAPDAHHIVSCSSDKTLKIYDLESRQLLRTLGGYIGDNYGVDKGWGSQTVPDSISRFIRGWESKNKRHLRSMEGHNGYATSIIITKDNQHVISGSLFSGIAMWQLETGWLWRSLERPNLPHLPIRNQHHVTSFYLPPDGCKIIAGYEVDALYTNKKDKHNKYSCYELGMWNLRNGRFLRQMFQYIKEDHDVSINAIAETSNGKWILSGASDNTIQVWDLKKGRMVGVMKDKGDTSTMVLTPDDRMVIGKENAINIWNIENETLIRSLEGHTDLVNSIVLTHNGKQILSGSLDRTLKVWDLQSGLLERNFRYTGGIFVVSPDDRRMIFVDNEHTIMSYDFMPGECTPLFDCDATIQCLTVSPDGHWLACGDIRGRVWIFEWII